MSAHVIERNGKPEYAVLPYEEYQRLLALAEETTDVRAFDEAVAQDEETLPADMVKRLLSGEHPLRVWRLHRGLTQTELGNRSGVNQTMIAMIEGGHRTGSADTLRRLAAALQLDLDDLVCQPGS